MSQLSDRQLVRTAFARLPLFSLLVLLFQLIIFMLTTLSDGSSSVFALQHTDDSLLNQWAFNFAQPLSHMGFNTLSSFFIHTDSSHFWTNFFLAAVSLCPVERACGARFVAGALVLGHLLGLLGGWLSYTRLHQSPLITGMSGGVLAASAAFLILTWGRWGLWMALPLSCLYAITQWISFVTHALSLLAGITLGYKKLRHIRSTTSGQDR